MEKQWFVIHTLTGKEAKVKECIERRIKSEEMGAWVGEVKIPAEKISEVKKGKKSTKTRMFFPGYVLVELDLYNEERKLNEQVWYFICNTPGVIGFIGGDRPSPLRPKEAEILFYQIDDNKEKIKPKVAFEPGETVKITDGPFLNFNGVLEEVDPERGKLKVSVSIFGRTAPVELEYWQVEHI